MTKHIEIGEIGNYYGGLIVKEVDGKYYWSIEDVSREDWQEIPKYLFDALMQFNSDTQDEPLTNP